jgi:hypothetical protein
MGGRYYYNKKVTADSSCKLRMSDLRKDGLLVPGYNTETKIWSSNMTNKKTIIGVGVEISDEPYARLVYSVTDGAGTVTDYDYQISLVTTPCNLGGVRYWFACPDCWSRVAVLYLAPGDIRFRCRHCDNLTYWSRNRCVTASFGHTSREIERLQKEIKRWTWRGRPTRKVRRLQALQWKMGGLSMAVRQRTDRMFGKLR